MQQSVFDECSVYWLTVAYSCFSCLSLSEYTVILMVPQDAGEPLSPGWTGRSVPWVVPHGPLLLRQTSHSTHLSVLWATTCQYPHSSHTIIAPDHLIMILMHKAILLDFVWPSSLCRDDIPIHLWVWLRQSWQFSNVWLDLLLTLLDGLIHPPEVVGHTYYYIASV